MRQHVGGGSNPDTPLGSARTQWSKTESRSVEVRQHVGGGSNPDTPLGSVRAQWSKTESRSVVMRDMAARNALADHDGARQGQTDKDADRQTDKESLDISNYAHISFDLDTLDQTHWGSIRGETSVEETDSKGGNDSDRESLGAAFNADDSPVRIPTKDEKLIMNRGDMHHTDDSAVRIPLKEGNMTTGGDVYNNGESAVRIPAKKVSRSASAQVDSRRRVVDVKKHDRGALDTNLGVNHDSNDGDGTMHGNSVLSLDQDAARPRTSPATFGRSVCFCMHVCICMYV